MDDVIVSVFWFIGLYSFLMVIYCYGFNVLLVYDYIYFFFFGVNYWEWWVYGRDGGDDFNVFVKVDYVFW